MSCWLWTLRKSKGQRTIGNAFFVPNAMCISGFNPFWAKMFHHISLTIIDFGKRKKRRERRGGRKGRQNKKRERKRRTGWFQLSNQNYPSQPVCRFSTFH